MNLGQFSFALYYFEKKSQKIVYGSIILYEWKYLGHLNTCNKAQHNRWLWTPTGRKRMNNIFCGIIAIVIYNCKLVGNHRELS